MMKLRSNAIIYGAVLCILVLFIATVAEARGRGGRGGGRSFSRSGPASRGSFSSRSHRTRQPTRQAKADRTQSARPSHTAAIGTERGNSRDRSGEKKQRDEGDREEAIKDHQDDRQEALKERQEDRQEAIEDVQEDRQDFIDDELDDNWDHDDDDFFAGVVVGGVLGGAAASASTSTSTTYIVHLPCTTSAVVVDGVSYYNCSSTWYKRVYSGSQVTYVAVNAPPGH